MMVDRTQEAGLSGGRSGCFLFHSHLFGTSYFVYWGRQRGLGRPIRSMYDPANPAPHARHARARRDERRNPCQRFTRPRPGGNTTSGRSHQPHAFRTVLNGAYKMPFFRTKRKHQNTKGCRCVSWTCDKRLTTARVSRSHWLCRISMCFAAQHVLFRAFLGT